LTKAIKTSDRQLRCSYNLPSSQRTTFTYDVFDRVTETRQLNAAGAVMDRQTTTYQDIFDDAGNRRITTTTIGTGAGTGNAPNIVTFVQYDRFGRRTQEGTIGGQIFTYNYDIAGRVRRE